MTFHWLALHDVPIYDQLHIEETLLRQDDRNFCIVSQGSPNPSIVMGISGKPSELIDKEKALSHNLPVIKRFSGGGTVVVDSNTVFVTFISQKQIHSFAPYPEPILKWSESIYKEVFPKDLFFLRENDYVLGERKCGGNAQYIRKERWLHHTSFLWDYDPSLMSALLHPKKTPPYRQGRNHNDFLCTIKSHFRSKELFLNKVKESLSKSFHIQEISLSDLELSREENVRKTTTLISF